MAEPPEKAVGEGPLAGAVVELVVGPPAHGGSCVARYGTGIHGDPDRGRAVFVRHALPGERVRARVTEDRGGSYCFADAVEILEASPERVEPPCPHAGPGRCGGCDWQHAPPSVQRALKRQVVLDQFRHLAGLDVSDLLGEVAPLPGGALGWRTRMVFAVDRDGRPGLRRHRSHEIEHVGTCPLGMPGVGDAEALGREWPGLTGVEVVRDGTGATATLAHRPGPGRQARGRRPPDRVELVEGASRMTHRVAGHELTVDAAGFWQVHPDAAQAFADALLAGLELGCDDRVLELYAGAGALTVALADAVGAGGAVLGLESSRQAVDDAADNLADVPHARVERGRVTADAVVAAAAEHGRFDAVVLDPPRFGAGRDAMAAIVGLDPRVIGYVACDPAALARDVSAARALGWELCSLTAFDAFPMTHHVECVAVLRPPGSHAE